MSYPTGKFRRLTRLADSRGTFSMLAIDQRKSLRQMISAKTGEHPDQVATSGLELVKRVVTKELASMASALLTDPLFGYPTTYDVVSHDTGVMLSIETTGYATVNQFERLTRLIPSFSVEQALISGADGIKLLIWYNKDASVATLEHQRDIVKRVGEACQRFEIPLILEIVTYPLSDADVLDAGYAKEKPHRVIDAAATFSAPEFGVDVLKMEFPGNLKFTEEFQNRDFGAGTSLYSLEDVRGYNRQLDQASSVPWVILSAGVDPDEFIENIHISTQAGASGFLCGRAVWKHIIKHYPDEPAMTAYIRDEASIHFQRILSSNFNAVAWHQHRRFKDHLRSDQ